IGHLVETFFAVRGRGHRANHLARGVLAVHAGQRLEVGTQRVCFIAGVIGVDADPVHLPPAANLLLADHRDVVLGLASHHTGIAARAGVLIDDHRPLVAVLILIVLVVPLGKSRGLRLAVTMLVAAVAIGLAVRTATLP